MRTIFITSEEVAVVDKLALSIPADMLDQAEWAVLSTLLARMSLLS